MDTATLPPVTEPKSAPPLLPPLFARPAAYLWLWLLPIAVLLTLNVQGYWIISGNMDPGQLKMAAILGVCGVANFVVGSVLYSITKWFSGKRSAAWWWGLPAIIVQAAYLWLAVSEVDNLLPRSVEAWIYPQQRFLFNQFAFAMLPLFFGILQVACATPARGTARPIILSSGMAIGAPLLLYLIAQALGHFSNPDAIGFAVLATIVITLGVVMFVGLVRALMLVLRFLQGWQKIAERVAVIVIALLLPLGGLYLNRSLAFPVDFQAWEVYALTLLNAAILVLATWIHSSWPRLSFNLLCATLPFSLYFFIVFLPYTPLSLLAILVLGAGMLVLTPTLLFILQVHLLNQSRVTLAHAGNGTTPTLIGGLICFLALPSFFTVRALGDKAALTSALDYTMTPSIPAGDSRYTGNLINLRRALASHRSYKNGIHYPLLSEYYGWLVFDNLVLPDPTLARLEETFFGTIGATQSSDPMRSTHGSLFGGSDVRDRMRMPRAVPLPHTAYVSDLQFRSAPAKTSTIVTLSMTLHNSELAAAEYHTTLPLPAGFFVRGFRLEVNGTMVPGRIFEKKTARWVYEMIRDSERRDPGLLYYAQPDELELKVFPVESGKPIKVEIDFYAAQNLDTAGAPIETQDPRAVLTWLRDLLRPQLAVSSQGVFLAATTQLAEILPAVEREPYLHVIVDRSEKNGFSGDLDAAIRLLGGRFPHAHELRVTLANYDIADVASALTPIGKFLRAPAADLEGILPRSGGLDLDRVVAHALRQHRDRDLDRPKTNKIPPRPVIVLLSRTAVSRKLALPVTEAWADLGPGLELEEIGEDGSHIVHRHSTSPNKSLVRCGDSMRPLAANVATTFNAGDQTDAVQYWSPNERRWREVVGVVREENTTEWSQAASLFLRQQAYARNPGSAGFDLASLVTASRESGILIPATSYIVVENSAQWRMLEIGERQKLGQNSALEFREAPAPSALLVAGIFGVYLYLRRRRRMSYEPQQSSAI